MNVVTDVKFVLCGTLKTRGVEPKCFPEERNTSVKKEK